MIICLILVIAFNFAFAQEAIQTPSYRIAFGTNVKDMTEDQKKLYGHQVKLSNEQYDGRRGSCGGVLLTVNHVLTAAHCVKGYNYDDITRQYIPYDSKKIDLYFGLVSLLDINRPDTERKTVYPGDWYVHPQWIGKNGDLRYDLTFIALKTPVRLLEGKIAPISLPTENFCTQNLEGKSATISGFGKTETDSYTNDLKSANVVIRGKDRCSSSWTYSMIPNQLYCVIGDDSASANRGDSGGPMIYNDANTRCVIGIASFIVGKDPLNRPAGYTRTCSHLPWIKNLIETTGPVQKMIPVQPNAPSMNRPAGLGEKQGKFQLRF